MGSGESISTAGECPQETVLGKVEWIPSVGVTEVLGDRRNGPACGWLMCIELSKEVSLLLQYLGWQRARGPKGRNLTQELNMCDAMKEKESEDSYSLRGNEK